MHPTLHYPKVIVHRLDQPIRRPRPGRAKTRRLTCLAVLAALIRLVSSSAFAWPFADHNWMLASDSEQDRLIAFQADGDARLEFFAGRSILERDGATATTIVLPEYDTDPYPAGLPAVHFENERGDVGDLDGDGDLDIVCSAVVAFNDGLEANYRMMVCRNAGNGAFVRGWHWKQNGSSTLREIGPAMRLADLDRDGDLDLIEGFDGLRVRWNPGNGDFSSSSTTLTAALKLVDDIEVADFDGDGWLDVLVVSGILGVDPDHPGWTTGQMVRFRNLGGTFGNSVITTLPTHDDFVQIEIADIDRDGRPDVVASRSHYDSSSLAWHRNTGTGFAAATALISMSATYRIHFAIGDLDEDDANDIVYSSRPGHVSWLRSTGPNTFGSPAVLRDPASLPLNYPNPIGLADQDGDGDVDILIDGGLRYLENTAPHRKAAAQASPWNGTSPSGVVDLTTGDINGDGRDDLIVADGGGSRILWYPGGASTLAAPLPVSTGGTAPTSVAAGDLDGDGDVDLAFANGFQVRRTLNAFGTGIGWYNELVATMPGANRLVAADGDGDRDIDLLASSPGSGVVRWHNNNGDATGWTSENVSTDANAVQRIAVGQTRPSRRPEIAIVVTPGSGTASYREYEFIPGTGWNVSNFRNAATGDAVGVVLGQFHHSFGLGTVTACGNPADGLMTAPSVVTLGVPTGAARNLAAVDWNRDGLMDVLCAHAAGVTLYLHNGAGNGNWAAVTLLAGVDCVDVTAIHLNQDRLMDAVAAVNGTGALHLIRNTSCEISLTHSVIPAGGVLSLAPGASGEALSISALSHGKPLSSLLPDASSTPDRVEFRFRKAVVAGNGYTPGGLMTAAEVDAVVQNVTFGNITATPDSVASGRFSLDLNSFAQGLLTIAPGATRTYEMGVKLTSTAADAPVTRFYLEHLAGGISDPSRWLTLAPSSSTGIRQTFTGTDVNVASVLVEVVTASLTPLESWRQANFGHPEGTGEAANDGDPDGDGVANLLEYLTSGNPHAADALVNSKGVVGLTSQGMNAPVLADLRLINDIDPAVRLTLEQSTDLKTWTVLATTTGSESWTGAQPATSSLMGGRTRFSFTTPAVPAATPHYFVRLIAHELP